MLVGNPPSFLRFAPSSERSDVTRDAFPLVRRRRRLDFSGKFQTKNSSSNRRNRDACLPACLCLPAGTEARPLPVRPFSTCATLF